jgi:hypothetical protein
VQRLTESGRDRERPMRPGSVPAVAESVPEEGAVPPLSPTCPLCSHPVLAGAYSSILNHGEVAHLKCPTLPPSINRWPEGIRRLLCLNCSRVFPSESKMERLCRACR